jgi:transposase
MIQGEGWYMIRELLREGLSISEIARRTGHDRKTIRKIRDDPQHPTPQERRKRGSKLDPYSPYLRQRVAAGVLNAVKLQEELRWQGYTGGVTLIRRFLHPLRQWIPAVTERFETPPGQQAQVDWSSCGHIWHRDRLRPLSSFSMTLCYSRRPYVEFTVSQDMETFLRCHINAFGYFGGVPREILYDNLKTAVDRRGPDGQVVWNRRFRDFADYYGFVPRACRPYRAQTKGKVENGIRYVKGNFLLGLDVARPPAALSADKAYDDGDLRRQLHCRGVRAAIPLRRQRNPTRLFLNERFSYDPVGQTMTCPARKVTSTRRPGPQRDSSRLVFIFDAADCRLCSLQARSTTSRKAGRRAMISQYREEHERARALARTEEYALLLRARSRIEPKYAEAKRFHGMRRARYRGLVKMHLQAYLTAAILNIKRMTRLLRTPNPLAQPTF